MYRGRAVARIAAQTSRVEAELRAAMHEGNRVAIRELMGRRQRLARIRDSVRAYSDDVRAALRGPGAASQAARCSNAGGVGPLSQRAVDEMGDSVFVLNGKCYDPEALLAYARHAIQRMDGVPDDDRPVFKSPDGVGYLERASVARILASLESVDEVAPNVNVALVSAAAVESGRYSHVHSYLGDADAEAEDLSDDEYGDAVDVDSITPQQAGDVVFIYHAIEQGSPEAYVVASERVQSNSEVAMEAVRQLPAVYAHVPEALRAASTSLALRAVRLDSNMLQYVPTTVPGYAQVATDAVRIRPLALAHASGAMRANPDLVHEAVTRDGEALKYASPQLQNDYQTVLAAVQSDGAAIQHAAPRFRDMACMGARAVLSNSSAWRFLTPRVRQEIRVVGALADPARAGNVEGLPEDARRMIVQGAQTPAEFLAGRVTPQVADAASRFLATEFRTSVARRAFARLLDFDGDEEGDFTEGVDMRALREGWTEDVEARLRQAVGDSGPAVRAIGAWVEASRAMLAAHVNAACQQRRLPQVAADRHAGYFRTPPRRQ